MTTSSSNVNWWLLDADEQKIEVAYALLTK
jgi:hypothetical protein